MQPISSTLEHGAKEDRIAKRLLKRYNEYVNDIGIQDITKVNDYV